MNKKYCEGYEGEGEVKIWYEENGVENGMVIWNGFFDTILEGCFISDFAPNGIVECFYNQNGFYDDKWEMKYPHIVMEELDRFNEQLLDTKNEEMVKKSQEILDQLKSFINNAMKRGYIIYVECS